MNARSGGLLDSGSTALQEILTDQNGHLPVDFVRDSFIIKICEKR